MSQPPFNCCGGNDESPQEHTQDCWKSINRFVEIEIAAGGVVRKPTSKAALKRLAQALKPLIEHPKKT